MKDFIKWLGVNEKVAKVAVWMLIIMVFLIVINTALTSLGFPHYAITYDNLKEINYNSVIHALSSWIVVFLNFFTTMLLIFRIKESKDIAKYGILYLILNLIVTKIFDKGIVQIFIFLFFIIFAYLYSKKNTKYILYAIFSLFINTIIQGLTYLYKANLIEFNELNTTTRSLLSIDYFIIIGIIIVVKEIYLKKRGEKTCGKDKAGYGGESSTKKTN